MKKRVFVTRQIPQIGIELLAERCDVDVWPGELPPPKSVLIEKAHEVDGILCMLTDPVDQEVIAAGKSLAGISTYAVGYDNIDISSATEAGIPVGHTPGVLTDATADLAFALLMAAARRLVEAADYARTGRWQTWSPTLFLGHDLKKATLGILGAGRIGRAVARRARGFEMEVLYHNPSRKPEAEAEGMHHVSFDELLERSDFLSLHVPLTQSTSGLLDTAAFARMKNSAVLINTARGPVIDHDALYTALEQDQIAYAALDVTDPEPLPADHPLYKLPNCLIVPHLGSANISTRRRMAKMAAENLLAALDGGLPPHCVNPDVKI